MRTVTVPDGRALHPVDNGKVAVDDYITPEPAGGNTRIVVIPADREERDVPGGGSLDTPTILRRTGNAYPLPSLTPHAKTKPAPPVAAETVNADASVGGTEDSRIPSRTLTLADDGSRPKTMDPWVTFTLHTHTTATTTNAPHADLANCEHADVCQPDFSGCVCDPMGFDTKAAAFRYDSVGTTFRSHPYGAAPTLDADITALP